MIESDGTGTMSGTLRGTLYYPSEQVSSHLHRRFSLAMAEHARCRLSESVYVNAIDESELINPVDHSGGFAGFVFGPCRKHFPPPKRGSFFGVGRVANPPNPETRRSGVGGSGRDAFAEVSAYVTQRMLYVSIRSRGIEALHDAGCIGLKVIRNGRA